MPHALSNVEQDIIQHKQIVRLHAACAVQIYAIVQNSIVFANPSTVLVHVKYANQKYFLFQTMKWKKKIGRKNVQTSSLLNLQSYMRVNGIGQKITKQFLPLKVLIYVQDSQKTLPVYLKTFQRAVPVHPFPGWEAP